MPLLVTDVYKLKSLRKARILTEESGFYNPVCRMGILDYEFITGNMKDEFTKNDFVLCSFLFAKDDSSLLVAAIKNLIENGVSLLGIKDVYYKKLPQDIIDYAMAKDFSMFLFSQEAYFEDIITEVSDTLRLIDNNQLVEAKLGSLIEGSLGKSVVRELALEINPEFKDHILAIHCKTKSLEDEPTQLRTLDRLKHLEYFQGSHSVFKFESGLLAILTFDHTGEIGTPQKAAREFTEQSGLNTAEYVFGISDVFPYLYQLNLALQESLYARQTAELEGRGVYCYQDIGIYKLLLPHMKSFWMEDFCNHLLTPLIEYDQRYSTDLFVTLQSYVEQGGNVKKTAEALFQHENTIRYRLNKTKDLLHMDQNSSFDAQVCIAVRSHILKTRS